MRFYSVVVVLVSLTIAAGSATAGHRAQRKTRSSTKHVAATTSAATTSVAPKRIRDRSIGAPWSGRLQAPVRLRSGDGYHLRRPHRTYGTRTTVDLVRQAIRDTLEAYPNSHVLAVGDLSQESGGWISEHNSHQSGRDVDLGLFYKHKPAGYPASFVRASRKTLDARATWKLVSNLARTSGEDGGVQMIFLDQGLHEVLYDWASAHGISSKRIAEVKHVLKHEPHHRDHLHVRFKCRARENRCR